MQAELRVVLRRSEVRLTLAGRFGIERKGGYISGCTGKVLKKAECDSRCSLLEVLPGLQVEQNGRIIYLNLSIHEAYLFRRSIP